MITDGFKRWNHGGCGTYATALIRKYPHLRLGGIDFIDPDNTSGYDNPGHYCAHDDKYAYDSTGIYPLPYTGCPTNSEAGRWLPDMGTPDDFGLPDMQASGYQDTTYEQDLVDALAHAERHGITLVIDAYGH